MKELIEIQHALKSPKSQINKFGGYAYRNCEDILTALKPLLKEHGCHITITDEMVAVLDRVYVKATVTLTNAKQEQVFVSAYARESLTKKGMDDSQITGAASSYARKYALNGMFAIDDTKDADSSAPTDVLTQINSCESLGALSDLWGRLNAKEQNSNRDAFSLAKEKFAPKGDK